MDANATQNLSVTGVKRHAEEDPRVLTTSYLMYKIGKTLVIGIGVFLHRHLLNSYTAFFMNMSVFSFQEKESTKFIFLFWFQ